MKNENMAAAAQAVTASIKLASVVSSQGVSDFIGAQHGTHQPIEMRQIIEAVKRARSVRKPGRELDGHHAGSEPDSCSDRACTSVHGCMTQMMEHSRMQQCNPKEFHLRAEGIETGDRLYSHTMANIGNPWLVVKRTQRTPDGSIRVMTESSDLRISSGMLVKVRRASASINDRHADRRTPDRPQKQPTAGKPSAQRTKSRHRAS